MRLVVAVLAAVLAGTPGVAVAAPAAGPTLTLGLRYDVVSGVYPDPNVAVPFTVTAGSAPVERVELYGDGQLQDVTEGVGSIVDTLYWHLVSNTGKHLELKLKAYDTAGDITELTRMVLVDNDKPVVTVQPADRAFVRGVIQPSVSGISDISGMGKFELQFAGQDQLVTYAGPWRFPVDTRTVPDGTQRILWRVYDKADHLVSIERLLTVDNRAPTVSFESAPADGAKLTGPVLSIARADDAYGVARVEFLINGAVAATDYERPYRWQLDPARFGTRFTHRYRAYDRAGNSTYGPIRTYTR